MAPPIAGLSLEQLIGEIDAEAPDADDRAPELIDAPIDASVSWLIGASTSEFGVSISEFGAPAAACCVSA